MPTNFVGYSEIQAEIHSEIRYSFVAIDQLKLVKIIHKKGEEIESAPERIFLKKIDENEIECIRNGKKPGVLVRFSERYFYAELPDPRVTINTQNVPHKCKSCEHVMATEDVKGGCQKVRDYNDKHLENYEFITFGFQTFNVYDPILLVYNCNKFEPFKPNKHVTKFDRLRMVENLRQLYLE